MHAKAPYKLAVLSIEEGNQYILYYFQRTELTKWVEVTGKHILAQPKKEHCLGICLTTMKWAAFSKNTVTDSIQVAICEKGCRRDSYPRWQVRCYDLEAGSRLWMCRAVSDSADILTPNSLKLGRRVTTLMRESKDPIRFRKEVCVCLAQRWTRVFIYLTNI